MKRDLTISAVLAAGLHVAVLFGIDAGATRNGAPAPEETLWVEVEVEELLPAPEPMQLDPLETVADGPPEPEPELLETEFASAEIEPEPVMEELEPPLETEPEPLAEATPLEPPSVLEETAAPPPLVDLPEPETAAPRPAIVSSEPAIGPPAANRVTVGPTEYVMLSQPNYRRQARQYYPELSRQRRETGVVVLTLFISPTGKAERIEVKESSGHALLDKAARDMARRSDYMPAFAGARPVPSMAEAFYTFRLD